MPPSIAANAAAEAVFLRAMEQAREAYDRLVELGLAEGRSRESVQEDARFVLPNAAETKIVVTMNARELRHFFAVRCCNRAQWEIRALAWELRGTVKQLAPALFHKSGPGCLYGTCPEGKMTCGKPYKAAEVDGFGNGGVNAAARPRLRCGRRAPRPGRRSGGHGRRHDARRRLLVAGRAPARHSPSTSTRGRSSRS